MTLNNGSLNILEPSHNAYKQTHTIRNYLYQSNLPKLEALTACFWLKLRNIDIGEPTIVSIATKSE